MNSRRWLAFVNHTDYNDNCRIIELHAFRGDTVSDQDTYRFNDMYYADNKPDMDIGLVKPLENDQAMITLEFRKTTAVDDIDLFVTFTKMEPVKTLCVAGPTEGDCGEMFYGGDSD